MIEGIIEGIKNCAADFEKPDEWKALRQWAESEKIPLVRPQTGRFLYRVCRYLKPESILEIGAGSGYSTLCLWQAGQDNRIDFNLTSIERDLNRYRHCSELFVGKRQIKLVRADALQAFAADSNRVEWGGYDLVFLDAQKRDYFQYLQELKPRIKAGGFLIADNVSFGGRVGLPDEKIKPRYRAGAELMRRFLEDLKGSPEFETIVLDMDDGLSVSRKREDSHE